MPSITQTNDRKIWVTWATNRDGNWDIYYKTAIKGGAFWSSETPLTTDEGQDIAPCITQTSDGKIWVVWTSKRTGNDDIWYKTSSDNGTTWTVDTPLVEDISEDRYPSIMQAENGTIWVLWTTDRNGNFEIYYKTSSDGGTSWSAEEDGRLTKESNDDMFPSIAETKNGTIWVVWDSDRIKYGPTLQLDLFFSTYDGETWSAETQFTTNDTDDFHPEIYQGKTDLWLVWVSNRLGNNDIFYKTLFIAIHNVAVTNVASPQTAYSGNTANATVVVKNKGTVNETFSVTAYRNATAIGTQAVTLSPDDSATLDFPWNTGEATMGARYVISATAEQVPNEIDTSDNSLTDGMIHVKILGDINGDNTVDIFDAIFITIYFGEPASSYPEADIDGDGSITVFDAAYITANYGKSV